MNIRDATEIAGTLSAPSKMPGLGYGLPAQECHVGTKLREVSGSTCEGCYAMKGNYMFANVQASQYRRLASIDSPSWPTAMAILINRQTPTDERGKRIRGKAFRRFFRWHDSGDLQSVAHLAAICRVCELTPTVAHWLPTRERKIVREYLRNNELPRNLTLRASATMIDAAPPAWFPLTSTVHRSKGSHPDECKAYQNHGECGTCRRCWGETPNVSYPKH